MIITLASFKGGVGKTTSSVHIAAFLQTRAKTLLIDGDLNRSASRWGRRGQLPFLVVDERQAVRYARGYDHVVIDTAARPDEEDLKTLAEGCDMLVIPATPDVLALEALVLTCDALKKLGTERFRVLITGASGRGRDVEEARDALTNIGLPVMKTHIRRLAAFQKAALNGVPVYEVKDKRAKLAWLDYENVGREILGEPLIDPAALTADEEESVEQDAPAASIVVPAAIAAAPASQLPAPQLPHPQPTAPAAVTAAPAPAAETAPAPQPAAQPVPVPEFVPAPAPAAPVSGQPAEADAAPAAASPADAVATVPVASSLAAEAAQPVESPSPEGEAAGSAPVAASCATCLSTGNGDGPAELLASDEDALDEMLDIFDDIVLLPELDAEPDATVQPAGANGSAVSSGNTSSPEPALALDEAAWTLEAAYDSMLVAELTSARAAAPEPPPILTEEEISALYDLEPWVPDDVLAEPGVAVVQSNGSGQEEDDDNDDDDDPFCLTPPDWTSGSSDGHVDDESAEPACEPSPDMPRFDFDAPEESTAESAPSLSMRALNAIAVALSPRAAFAMAGGRGSSAVALEDRRIPVTVRVEPAIEATVPDSREEASDGSSGFGSMLGIRPSPRMPSTRWPWLFVSWRRTSER
jgi:chromosome partitioning protein